MKEEIENGSIVERSSRLLKARIVLVLTSLVLILFPTDYFYSASAQGPVGGLRRVIKSLEKAAPIFYVGKKAIDAQQKMMDTRWQNMRIDSTSFSTNAGFYKTQGVNIHPYVGPYNQWQTGTTFINTLDAIDLEMKVREYHVGANVNVVPLDNSNTQLQTSPTSAVINHADSLELQRKMLELKKSIENTRKSFNGKSK